MSTPRPFLAHDLDSNLLAPPSLPDDHIEPPPVVPLELCSDSETDDDEDEDEEDAKAKSQRAAERLRILAAAGLVRRPAVLDKSRAHRPRLSSDSTDSVLVISNPPHVSSRHKKTLTLPTRQPAPSTPAFQASFVEPDDGPAKMEDPLARYMRVQRDSHPGPRDEPPPRSQPPSFRTKWPSSGSIFPTRPTPDPTSSPRLLPRSAHLPLSASGLSGTVPTPPPSSSGFRAWLAGMSRSASAATLNPPDRRRPSFRGQEATHDKRSPSVSGPIPVSEHGSLKPRRSSASGVISMVPNSSASALGGSLAPQTWTSLMGPTVVSNYTEKERNRQEAIYELIKTESGFVENCQALMQVFYHELERLVGFRACMVIFANIEEIVMFGTTFLSALEDRQSASEFVVERIGDLVVDYMDGVGVYKPYCVNQSNGSRVLSELKKKQPQVAATLSGLKVKGLELEHYLLQPMQRLTRYPLLLSQIIKYTDESLPEYHLLTVGLKKAQRVLTSTNEAIRKQEQEIVLAALSEQLVIPGSDAKLNLATMTRFVGPRRLIKDGLVCKSRSRKTFHAYLFNDFFLLTRLLAPASPGLLDAGGGPQQVMYRAPMALEECQFTAGKDDQTFVVVHSSEMFCLKVADGPRACAKWKEELAAARRSVFVALSQKKFKRASWTSTRNDPIPPPIPPMPSTSTRTRFSCTSQTHMRERSRLSTNSGSQSQRASVASSSSGRGSGGGAVWDRRGEREVQVGPLNKTSIRMVM